MNFTICENGEVVKQLKGCFGFSFAFAQVEQHEAFTDPCLVAASSVHRVGVVALRISVILVGQDGVVPLVKLLAPDGFFIWRSAWACVFS